MAFHQSGPRWLGISDLIAEPEGPTFISYKVARSRLNRLRFVTQDPKRASVGTLLSLVEQLLRFVNLLDVLTRPFPEGKHRLA